MVCVGQCGISHGKHAGVTLSKLAHKKGISLVVAGTDAAMRWDKRKRKYIQTTLRSGLSNLEIQNQRNFVLRVVSLSNRTGAARESE